MEAAAEEGAAAEAPAAAAGASAAAEAGAAAGAAADAASCCSVKSATPLATSSGFGGADIEERRSGEGGSATAAKRTSRGAHEGGHREEGEGERRRWSTHKRTGHACWQHTVGHTTRDPSAPPRLSCARILLTAPLASRHSPELHTTSQIISLGYHSPGTSTPCSHLDTAVFAFKVRVFIRMSFRESYGSATRGRTREERRRRGGVRADGVRRADGGTGSGRRARKTRQPRSGSGAAASSHARSVAPHRSIPSIIPLRSAQRDIDLCSFMPFPRLPAAPPR